MVPADEMENPMVSSAPSPAHLTQDHKGENPLQNHKGLQSALPRHGQGCELHHAVSLVDSTSFSELCCVLRHLLVFVAARG